LIAVEDITGGACDDDNIFLTNPNIVPGLGCAQMSREYGLG